MQEEFHGQNAAKAAVAYLKGYAMRIGMVIGAVVLLMVGCSIVF